MALGDTGDPDRRIPVGRCPRPSRAPPPGRGAAAAAPRRSPAPVATTPQRQWTVRTMVGTADRSARAGVARVRAACCLQAPTVPLALAGTSNRSGRALLVDPVRGVVELVAHHHREGSLDPHLDQSVGLVPGDDVAVVEARPRNLALRRTVAPCCRRPGRSGRLDVMPPVQRRSFAGSTMTAATSARGRWIRTSGRTSTVTARPPVHVGPVERSAYGVSGKNGCGVPVSTYLTSRSRIMAQVWAVCPRSVSG